MRVRAPAVASIFYPDDPAELRKEVKTYLEKAETVAGGALPKALIAPHAGYRYSGPVAGSAYARIAQGRGTIKRVVLMGPAHRIPIRGLAITTADVFHTPLGDILIDKKSIAALKPLPQIVVSDEAHRLEHSLETQLPFLQEVLGDFQLVPLVVGDATNTEVAEVLELLWGGPETLLVISSDLSHFLSYEEAKTLDNRTAQSIEACQPDEIAYEQACGGIPIKGLLSLASKYKLRVTLLDLRNSGDTAGPRHQVVGYGAFAITAGDTGQQKSS